MKKSLLLSMVTMSICYPAAAAYDVNSPAASIHIEEKRSSASSHASLDDDSNMTVAPFTGLRANRTGASVRPVMVMVENSARARPQTGLDQADLIYEILAEGDITRFAAVYHSRAPETVGPVRSIRPYFVEIGDGIDAFIVHAGWSQEAMNMIAARSLSHFDQVYGDSAYYWRSRDRKPPHNLYTGIGRIRDGAVQKKLRQEWDGQGPQFVELEGIAAYSEHNRRNEQPAAYASIHYLNGYKVEYRYDSASGLYLRSMAGEAHVDGITGKQLAAANVLVCESSHRMADNEGRRSVDVFGPGKGVLIQHGVKKDIVWERKAGMIRAYMDGVEQSMLPGQTWVQIVPEGSLVTVSPE